MLKGASIPRLSHILKSIQKNANNTGWMKTMNEEHLSCWLMCLSASRDLELALDPRALHQRVDRLDLRPTFGGAGIHSLINSADEEFVGSFAVIAFALVSLCKKTNLSVYIKIAEALEELDGPQLLGTLSATVTKVKEVSTMLHSQEIGITDEELVSASQLVKGHRVVEVSGLEYRALAVPKPMRPPDPRGMADYITTPCKHECAIFKQGRHTKQAHGVLASLDPVRSATMRASAGQHGLDSS
jgi:hypothetical protein